MTGAPGGRPAPAAFLGLASGKGRGVFAARDIAAGEAILDDPAIAFSIVDRGAIGRTVVDNYYFAHPDDGEGGLLAFGLASLCNHSETPNAEPERRRDPALGWFVTMRALRPIAAGEEITFHYVCPLWFEPEG